MSRAGDTLEITIKSTGETLRSLENVVGTAFNDEIHGDAGNNVLTGGAGSDLLDGRSGDDTLMGGAGSDTMDGYLGNDTYEYSRGDGDDSLRRPQPRRAPRGNSTPSASVSRALS